MSRIVIDGLIRFFHPRRAEIGFPRVQVPVEPREVAARNIEPDPMTYLEQVGGSPEIDGVFVGLARLDGLSLLR